MPKHNQTSSERSKIRIMFVEGDFAPGDFHELTHALQNAIRPGPFLVRHGLPTRPGASAATGAVKSESVGEVAEAEVEALDEGQEGDGQVETTGSARGPARSRYYRKARPVEMDMAAGGKPFEDYAAEKGPTSHRSRYLVAAAWLHELAKIEAVTADHVFTCYKTASWTFDVIDPTATFRQLKKEGLGSLKHGTFSINHLGLSEVARMRASA